MGVDRDARVARALQPAFLAAQLLVKLSLKTMEPAKGERYAVVTHRRSFPTQERTNLRHIQLQASMGQGKENRAARMVDMLSGRRGL